MDKDVLFFSAKKSQSQILKKNGSNPDRKLWNFCIDGCRSHCIKFGDHLL